MRLERTFRATSLYFALTNALVAFVIKDGAAEWFPIMVCCFWLGVWFCTSLNWRLNQARENLITTQRELLNELSTPSRFAEDDADWWKKN